MIQLAVYVDHVINNLDLFIAQYIFGEREQVN